MTDEIRVLYNAACPVCRAEIDHYAVYARKQGLPIRFDDLNDTDLDGWGIGADEAAQRLHLRKGGEILGGIDAFVELWRVMPRWRLLAATVGSPLVRQLAALVYDRVLAPALYRRHLARVARAGCDGTGAR